MATGLCIFVHPCHDHYDHGDDIDHDGDDDDDDDEEEEEDVNNNDREDMGG